MASNSFTEIVKDTFFSCWRY